MNVFQGTKVVEKGNLLLFKCGSDHEIRGIRRGAAQDRETSENVKKKKREREDVLFCFALFCFALLCFVADLEAVRRLRIDFH